MTGTHKIVRLAVRINDRSDRGGFFLGGNTGLVCNVIDWNGKCRLQWCSVVCDHWCQFKSFARFGQNRHTNLPASVLEHEVDLGIGNGFGGADEVAFVFPVFVIHDDDDFPGFDGGERLFD